MIPKTNVAESAEVTKNVHNKTIATKDIIFPKGICSITTNNAVSVTSIAFAAISGPKFIPVAPNTANHRKEPKAGINDTPRINSLIVLPLDIRAINTPTNGTQAIHQAQ